MVGGGGSEMYSCKFTDSDAGSSDTKGMRVLWRWDSSEILRLLAVMGTLELLTYDLRMTVQRQCATCM